MWLDKTTALPTVLSSTILNGDEQRETDRPTISSVARVRPVFHPDLASYLKGLREERGLGQRQAASLALRRGLKLTHGVLYNLENGKTKNPSTEVLHDVAALYGVAYEEVLGRVIAAQHGLMAARLHVMTSQLRDQDTGAGPRAVAEQEQIRSSVRQSAPKTQRGGARMADLSGFEMRILGHARSVQELHRPEVLKWFEEQVRALGEEAERRARFAEDVEDQTAEPGKQQS